LAFEISRTWKPAKPRSAVVTAGVSALAITPSKITAASNRSSRVAR